MGASKIEWLGWAHASSYHFVDDDECLCLPQGKRVQVRWVFQSEQFALNGGDEQYFVGMAYDDSGTFYGVTAVRHESDDQSHTIETLTGKSALNWFARHCSWDEGFARELCRAIDNPEFEFMSLVPKRTPPKRQRKARKRAEAFHEQLHMATALVECLRKLEDAPTLENLAEACRSASAVHAAIHAPENFKLAAAI